MDTLDLVNRLKAGNLNRTEATTLVTQIHQNLTSMKDIPDLVEHRKRLTASVTSYLKHNPLSQLPLPPRVLPTDDVARYNEIYAHVRDNVYLRTDTEEEIHEKTMVALTHEKRFGLPFYTDHSNDDLPWFRHTNVCEESETAEAA